MTKFNFAACVFVFLFLAGHAEAQLPSLASMPTGEKFTSEKYGFSIALPPKPTETSVMDTAAERGETITWLFKEGMISVAFGEYLDGTSITTESGRTEFLRGFKGVFTKSEQVKSLAERPYAVGDYKGVTYTMTFDGDKSQVSAILWGTKHFTITSMAYRSVAGSGDLIFRAVNSFDLVHGGDRR